MSEISHKRSPQTVRILDFPQARLGPVAQDFRTQRGIMVDGEGLGLRM